MDIERLLSGFLGNTGSLSGAASAAKQAVTGSTAASLGSGALAGGAVAMLLGNKKARKLGGKALKYGGIAAVGGLAYLAYRNYKASQPAGSVAAAPLQAIPVPPEDSGFRADVPDAQGNDLRLGLIQAMIAAAKADGHIDTEEHTRISNQIGEMDLAADEKAFLFDAMNAPADPLMVANLARDEAQGAELYFVSVMAIDTDTPEEQRYLDRLGDALRLPEALRQELVAHAANAKAQADQL